jgi:hypothetical protein
MPNITLEWKSFVRVKNNTVFTSAKFSRKKVYNRDYGWTCLGFPVQCITNSVELPNQAKASTANHALAASFCHCMPALMLHNVGAKGQCYRNTAVIYCSTNIFEG